MEVVVRLFAGLRERAGTGERRLELPEGSCVADVWAPLEGSVVNAGFRWQY